MRVSVVAWHKEAGQRWLQQQARDPFVAEARKRNYVARSALKLTHMDDCYTLFARNHTRAVVDLGCSPGGWCQVIRERTNDACCIVGVDLLAVRASVPGAYFVRGDFTSATVQQQIMHILARHAIDDNKNNDRNDDNDGDNDDDKHACVDVVTSDVCPNRIGGTTDRHRSCALNEAALQLALRVLVPDGHFVCKVLGGRASYEQLYARACRHFTRVHVCKPPASRVHSDESFLVALRRLHAARAPRGACCGGGGSDSGATRAGHYNLRTPHGRTLTLGRFGLDDWPGMTRTRTR